MPEPVIDSDDSCFFANYAAVSRPLSGPMPRKNVPASAEHSPKKQQLHPTIYNPSILLKDWSNSPKFGDEMRQTGEDMIVAQPR